MGEVVDGAVRGYEYAGFGRGWWPVKEFPEQSSEGNRDSDDGVQPSCPGQPTCMPWFPLRRYRRLSYAGCLPRHRQVKYAGVERWTAVLPSPPGHHLVTNQARSLKWRNQRPGLRFPLTTLYVLPHWGKRKEPGIPNPLACATWPSAPIPAGRSGSRPQ
jgi:hypothetical protein